MVMKTFFIFNRGGEILFHWSAQEENDKQLSVNAVIKDRLLRKKSEDKLLFILQFQALSHLIG